MFTSQHQAKLTISVDLEPLVTSVDFPQMQSLVGCQLGLLDLLSKHQFVATWGVSRPETSILLKKLTHSTPRHCVALILPMRLETRMQQQQVPRLELEESLQQFQAIGLPCSTVFCDSPANHRDIGHLSALGITALRHGRNGRYRKAAPLRDGLWQFSTTLTLTHKKSWLPRSGCFYEFTKELKKAINNGRTTHLGIESSFWETNRFSTRLKTLDRLLEWVSNQRNAGRVEILTLSQFVDKETDRARTPPTRSVLRYAA